MDLRFTFLMLLMLLHFLPGFGQTLITGNVTDKKGEPLPGANIYIKGSFDGATSDVTGKFSFKTEEMGLHTIIASFMGYHPLEKQIETVNDAVSINFSLEEIINRLDGVTITAGAFEASDEKKGVVLKPLDIAMTAGATADISGALNTLPGTQTVGESGRLFVRGGESHETKVFVDGLQVNNFFGISAPNTPARGRFSPFLFKGTIFSTGGYSAEYGQALSSALMLNSNDFPDEERTDINIMSVGLGVAKTKIWNRTSLTAEINYTNLTPYIALVKQKIDWEKAPEAAEASFVFRQKNRKNGLLKIYGNINRSGLEMNQSDLNKPDFKNRINLGNRFYYLNASYKDNIADNWYFSGGSSIGITEDNTEFNNDQVDERELNVHTKGVLSNDVSDKVTLRFGGEFFNDLYKQSFYSNLNDKPFTIDYSENLASLFIESDIYFSNRFVFRGGVRAERSELLRENNIAPRLSLAYKTGDKGQFSIAYGEFFQSPQKQYLKFNNQLDFTKAIHYIINYQRIHDDRIFRIEAYRKDYSDLIKFDSNGPVNFSGLNNLGNGFANGIDLFIRDRKTIKNGDYWISYSFLDSKRNHQDYSESSRLPLFSKHNFSVVYKHFLRTLRTQIGATYNFASHRPYHDPNIGGFMNSKTKSYNDISFNAAFLYKQNVVLYFSATNLLGFENIFGYQFADRPDETGYYKKQAIGQPAPRFIFLGLFITISKNKESNQLENLN